MTAPPFSSADEIPLPSEYGPDSSATTRDKSSAAAKPATPGRKRAPRSASDVFKGLGQNKKRRSPVRPLTLPKPEVKVNDDGSEYVEELPEELSDFEKMVQLYEVVGAAVSFFHPKLGTATQMQAHACVNAWFKVAHENDAVRAGILAVVEGGQWGGLFMAHLPMLIAAMPESTVNRLFSKGAFAAFGQMPEPSTSDGPQYPADLYGPDGTLRT